jgi:hypothetical protein
MDSNEHCLIGEPFCGAIRDGDRFEPPEAMHDAFDVVLELTCMSALPPTMCADYLRGSDLTLRRGGLLIGI